MKIGLIGTGAVAQNHAYAAFQLGHDITVVTAANKSSPRLKAFLDLYPDAKAAPSYREILADPLIDAIVVCASWNAIPDMLAELLACPKPILIEKPVALHSDDLSVLLEKAGLHLENKIVGFNRRFYETVVALKNRIDKGGLKAIDVVISESATRLAENHGSGLLPHLLAYSSSHTLDLILHLFGNPVVVAVEKNPEQVENTTIHSYSMLLKSPTGVPITVRIAIDDPLRAGILCSFEDHSVWHLHPLEHLTVFSGYQVFEPEPGSSIRRYSPRAIDEVVENSETKPGFSKQMSAFLSGNYGQAARLTDSLALLTHIDEIECRALSS